MAAAGQSYEAELEHRLELASRSENMGEELVATDYVMLLIVTIAVPAALMITAWYL